jgi:hypothetical protein
MALSANAPRVLRNVDGLMYQDIIVANAVTIYAGALCAVVAADGLLTPAADSTTLKFAGVSIGPNGDGTSILGDGSTTYCRVVTNCEALLPCAATVTAADKFEKIYCTADDEVTDVTTLGPICGVHVEQESTTTAWIRLGAPVLAPGS